MIWLAWLVDSLIVVFASEDCFAVDCLVLLFGWFCKAFQICECSFLDFDSHKQNDGKSLSSACSKKALSTYQTTSKHPQKPLPSSAQPTSPQREVTWRPYRAGRASKIKLKSLSHFRLQRAKPSGIRKSTGQQVGLRSDKQPATFFNRDLHTYNSLHDEHLPSSMKISSPAKCDGNCVICS